MVNWIDTNSKESNLDQLKGSDFQAKYEAITKEINEVIWATTDQKEGENDKSEINTEVVKSLDWAFGKMLNDEQLKILKNAVNKIKNNPDLSMKAGDGLKILEQFLNDISNPERNEKDYKEFMDRIKDPSSLNGLKEYEVRRLILHLLANDSDAMNAYKQMKSVVWKFEDKWMKSTDVKYFNTIWNALKDKYWKNEKFFEEDYGKLDSSSKSIKDFVEKNWFILDGREGWRTSNDLSNWDWHSKIDKNFVIKRQNSIVSPDYVAEKFNQMNHQRVEKNEAAVKNINFDSNSLLDLFFLKGNELNWLWSISGKISSENILNSLQVGGLLTNETSINGADFINSEDRKKTLEDCKWALYDKILNTVIQLERNYSMQLNGTLWEGTVFDAVSKIAGQNKFIERDSNWNVTYFPDKAAAYLSFINTEWVTRKNYKDLSLDDGHRQAWIAAVQVLLNNIPGITKDNPLKVNWKLDQSNNNDPTLWRVMEFQKSKSDVFWEDKWKGFKVDWLPWPNTIKELIENQWDVSAKERTDRIQAAIAGLKEVERSEFGDRTAFNYNIPDKVTIYSKDLDSDNIYYREWNVISKISKDKPWEISQAKLDDEWKVTWETPKLNVCPDWASKLQDSLKALDNSIIIDGTSKENYKLTLGEGDTRVNINVGDSVYKAEWFCGKTEMVDRFKLIALAAKVKKEVWNVGVKNGWLWIVKADFNGDTNNTLMNFNELGVYWLDQYKVEDFVDYCNNLKKDSETGVYNYVGSNIES